jgi:hypothetical protein
MIQSMYVAPFLRRAVLLVYRNSSVASLLCSMLAEWHLDVTVTATFDGYKAAWSAASSPHFSCIMFDIASVLACSDLPYLRTLHGMTRRTRTTLVAFIPLVSTRRSPRRYHRRHRDTAHQASKSLYGRACLATGAFSRRGRRQEESVREGGAACSPFHACLCCVLGSAPWGTIAGLVGHLFPYIECITAFHCCVVWCI